MPPVQTLVQDVDLFRSLGPWFSPWSNLASIINTLFVLLWNPGPARRNPTNIIAATCGRFHAVILQEASDHVPHISDQFIAYTGNTDLAILLNKDTFEPDPMVFAFKEDSTSKGTWSMALHFLEHQRSHFALYTSTMSWPRNVMLPLIFYGGYMGT